MHELPWRTGLRFQLSTYGAGHSGYLACGRVTAREVTPADQLGRDCVRRDGRRRTSARLLHSDDDCNVLASSTHAGVFKAMWQASTEFEALEFLDGTR
jgi:hypothetical protein